MDQDVTLEDLCRAVGGCFSRLDCVCDNHHLLEVAISLRQWRTLAPWLDFDAAAVEDLDHNRSDEEGTRQQMLLLWKRAKGCDATYRALAEVLLKAKRRELAEKVVKCSNKAPANMSTASSQRSSCYQTPLGSPRPGSHYNTAHQSGVSTPLRTFLSASSELHLRHHIMLPQTQQAFPGGQDGQVLQSQVSQQQEQQVPSGVPMQTTNDQSRDDGMLCMSTAPVYYPTGMYQRFSSVCEKGARCGIPPQTTTEIMQLQQKVQMLENDLKIANQRHKRELLHMKEEQKGERNEYEDKVHLLHQQLQESHLNAKFWESTVAQLTAKLQLRETCSSTNTKGEDHIDFPIEVSLTTTRTTSTSSALSSSVVSRADSGEHQTYTVQSCVCEHREETTRTLVCLRACSISEDGGGNHKEVEDNGCNCNSECKNCAIVNKFRQVQGVMEEKHSERDRNFKESVRSELAAHHLHFLQVNGRLTDIVSQSLECLSSGHDDVDSTAVEGVGEDLRWLQEKLESCRLARHASWP